MPFCSQCGTKVGEVDYFCANCGARQPASRASAAAVQDALANFSPHTLAVLCYIPLVGWIASVIVLGSRRFRTDRDLRFHAFQGLYIFAAWLLVDWAIQPAFHARHFGFLLHAFLLGIWIFMLVKTKQGELYALPLFGELAHRSVNERI